MDTNTIQIVVQAGAIGILLVFGLGIYRLARRLIEVANNFVTNHIEHLISTLERVEKALTRLDETVDRWNRSKK